MVQYTVHPLTKLSHPFLDSSAVHRSSYRLTYRWQQLRSELIQLSSRHIQLRSTPMHGKLEVFLLWVAKHDVCPQLDGVYILRHGFSAFPSLCHHWAMATEQHQYTISHMTTCCTVLKRQRSMEAWNYHIPQTRNQKPRLKNVWKPFSFETVFSSFIFISPG